MRISILEALCIMLVSRTIEGPTAIRNLGIALTDLCSSAPDAELLGQPLIDATEAVDRLMGAVETMRKKSPHQIPWPRIAIGKDHPIASAGRSNPPNRR